MWIEGVGEGDNGYAWRPQQGGPACFAKGGPGKNHQARLPGALVGLEGLSFILSCTELWNTVYTHIVSNFSSWGVPMERFNSSPVPPNFMPRNISSYTAFISGRLHTWFGSAESWSNILCPNIRCVSSRYNNCILQNCTVWRVKTPVVTPYLCRAPQNFWDNLPFLYIDFGGGQGVVEDCYSFLD